MVLCCAWFLARTRALDLETVNSARAVRQSLSSGSAVSLCACDQYSRTPLPYHPPSCTCYHSFRGLEKPNELSELRQTVERPAAVKVHINTQERGVAHPLIFDLGIDCVVLAAAAAALLRLACDIRLRAYLVCAVLMAAACMVVPRTRSPCLLPLHVFSGDDHCCWTPSAPPPLPVTSHLPKHTVLLRNLVLFFLRRHPKNRPFNFFICFWKTNHRNATECKGRVLSPCRREGMR